MPIPKQIPGPKRLSGLAVPMLAVFPVLMLFAFWLGGETALTALAIGLPVLVAGATILVRFVSRDRIARDTVTGLMQGDGFAQMVDHVFDVTRYDDLRSACLLVEIDDSEELALRYGQKAMDDVALAAADRIVGVLRAHDSVARLGKARFGVCLTPVRPTGPGTVHPDHGAYPGCRRRTAAHRCQYALCVLFNRVLSAQSRAQRRRTGLARSSQIGFGRGAAERSVQHPCLLPRSAASTGSSENASAGCCDRIGTGPDPGLVSTATLH